MIGSLLHNSNLPINIFNSPEDVLAMNTFNHGLKSTFHTVELWISIPEGLSPTSTTTVLLLLIVNASSNPAIKCLG